ncbi:MAG: ABC transporter permease [bacterium]
MKTKNLAIPYAIWLGILVFIPVMALLILTVTITNGLDFSNATFTLENFFKLTDPVYSQAFLNSIIVAFWTTIICFIIGYPVAYIISNSKIKYKSAVLMLIILPMWSNMLLRIVAWEKIFYPVSIINNIGLSLDLIGSIEAVIFVTVTMYLPFMIFPIFTILEKSDKSLIEASNDLGVGKIKTFLFVTFPLSLKGVCSGVIMVFLPAATGFAVSERIGAGKITMIGNIIEDMFTTAFNYNFGALLAIVVSVVITISVVLFQKVDKDGETLL